MRGDGPSGPAGPAGGFRWLFLKRLSAMGAKGAANFGAGLGKVCRRSVRVSIVAGVARIMSEGEADQQRQRQSSESPLHSRVVPSCNRSAAVLRSSSSSGTVALSGTLSGAQTRAPVPRHRRRRYNDGRGRRGCQRRRSADNRHLASTRLKILVLLYLRPHHVRRLL